MYKSIHLITVLFILSVLYACSENEMSNEDRIRQYIDAGKLAAENRSHSDFSDLIYKSYLDTKGLNKQQLEKLVRAYFFRHKNIHLLIKVDEIVVQGENLAYVTMHVAMAGNVISDANALTSLRANIYKFELQLINDDEWLLQQASWQKATVKDMLSY